MALLLALDDHKEVLFPSGKGADSKEATEEKKEDVKEDNKE